MSLIAAKHSTVPLMNASTVLRHDAGVVLSNAWMKGIGQIRRERLALLLKETAATLADISEKLGRSRRDATLSQVANAAPNTRTGKARQMGDEQARAIERAFGKPTGWFDRDPYIDELEAQLAMRVGEPLPTYGGWPFSRVPMSRVLRLDSAARQRVEDALLGAILLVESEKQGGSEGDLAA